MVTSRIEELGELFSGPGGMALGAHRAAARAGVELKHAWANDYDRDSVETYRKNIPGASDSSVICADVRSLDFQALPPITGLAFGFPCNDFSLVGEQKGVSGKFGPLYRSGVDALDALNPDWFVAENVGGIRSANEGQAFAKILSELSRSGKEGYAITPHLYRFEEYGVPQARHRVIIVGFRSGLGIKFLPPSSKPYRDADVSARSALENPPIAPGATNNERTVQSARVVERLRAIPPGKNAFNADLPASLQLNVKGARMSQIYRRLHPEKPSYTVTGSGGGGTHVYHWDEPRALTNRERARLQTFPDDFHFFGGKESVRKQIGMAVPVAGAAVVFEALFNSLLGQNYEITQPNLQKFSDQAVDILEGLNFDQPA